ncbi:MAG TPA: PspC domain-containing protein [Marmoricola sp.]
MTAPIPTSPESAPAVRRAHRSVEGGLLGGVAAGLADHLRLPVFWVRVAFVVAAIANGFGIIVYLGLWIWLPSEAEGTPDAPGLDAASRQGRRPRPQRRIADYGVLVAFGAIAIGGLALVAGLTGTTLTVVPVVIGIAGLAMLWRQADEVQRERWTSTGPVGVVVGTGGWASYLRLLAGLVLLITAILAFVLRSGGWREALVAAGAALLGIVGILFIAGPWLMRLSRDLADERAARARAQERADVAAHLHDSVLQTLAMIQRSAADPATVAKLARAQERDLRSWLFEAPASTADSIVAALREAAAEIEDSFGVPVEVVAVGDRSLPEEVMPVVLAAREAMANAAEHSGAAKVDVYCEVEGAAVEVFVRDRGRGFDPAVVPDDRAGVRNSIIGRMERHGGRATIRSGPEGTEVTVRWKPRES